MATRIDKYDPVDGGFRGVLAADTAITQAPIGVGLDVDGHVVPGAGVTGIKGVLVLTKAKKAGDVVDVMTDGELDDLLIQDRPENGGPATYSAADPATNYYAAAADGIVSDQVAPGDTQIGWTMDDPKRMVVRVDRGTFVAGPPG